jgi:hypothetical protein
MGLVCGCDRTCDPAEAICHRCGGNVVPKALVPGRAGDATAIAAVDGLLSVLRRHGAVEFEGLGVKFRLAPVIAPGDKPAIDPLAEVREAMARMGDLMGKRDVA